jgi:hypothetical protein
MRKAGERDLVKLVMCGGHLCISSASESTARRKGKGVSPWQHTSQRLVGMQMQEEEEDHRASEREEVLEEDSIFPRSRLGFWAFREL